MILGGFVAAGVIITLTVLLNVASRQCKASSSNTTTNSVDDESTTITRTIEISSTISSILSTNEATITTASRTTKSAFNFLARWNPVGVTVAGITSIPGLAANLLYHPRGLASDSSDTLYIADEFNRRVQKWLPGASSGTTVAALPLEISGPLATYTHHVGDMDADSNGNLFIADPHNHRILFWANGASSGKIVAGNGSAGSSNHQLDRPWSIAVDWNSKTLYISDLGNHRVMSYKDDAISGVVVAGGNGPGTLNTQLDSPRGLCFDSVSNSLYIANPGANNVVHWVIGDSSWTLVADSHNVLGLHGCTSELLLLPEDVTLDSMGNVYVADGNNHRVLFFSAGQTSGITIAGTCTRGSSATQLNLAIAVVVDTQFNVYVADFSNHRVQKFEHY